MHGNLEQTFCISIALEGAPFWEHSVSMDKVLDEASSYNHYNNGSTNFPIENVS